MAGIDNIESESAVKDLDISSIMGFEYMSVIQEDPPTLAQFLKEVNAPSGSASDVQIDTKILEQAKEKFRCAKMNYLRKKITYDEIQSIVLTSKKPSDPDAYRFPVAREVFVMKAAKVKATSVLGQVQLLKDDDFPAMKVPNDELVDLQKEFSNCLQEKGADLAQFYDSISIDKDPNAVAHSKDDREYWSKKFLDLPLAVHAMQKRLEDGRARLEKAAATRQSELTEYCWALQAKDAQIVKSIAELVSTNDYDEEEFSYLCTKLETCMQKIGLFTKEVEAKTYSPTVVEAHKKIQSVVAIIALKNENHSQLIQKATEEAKTTSMVCRQQLDEYESASPEVKALIEKVLSLRRECKECEWQLMKVRESEKQLPPYESQ